MIGSKSKSNNSGPFLRIKREYQVFLDYTDIRKSDGLKALRKRESVVYPMHYTGTNVNSSRL